MVNCARHLPTSYNPPSPYEIGSIILNKIYDNNFSKIFKRLTTYATVYGVSLFGDGATIMTYLLVNVLGAGVYRPYVVLDIVNFTGHFKGGKKKDAPYITNFSLPITKDLEKSNPEGKSNGGIVDLMLSDGATNVQNAVKIMARRYPLITVLHRTEHVVSLLLKDFYKRIPEFALLRNFTQQARNMFVSIPNAPTEMFGKYSKKHNKGIKIGFIKPCDFRMDGEFT